MTKFGNALRECRQSRHYTRRELATIAKMSVETIAQYENNRRAPTLKNLLKLIKALDVSADALLFDRGFGREAQPKQLVENFMRLSDEGRKYIEALTAKLANEEKLQVIK
jgi:transcriptional regulator with XRE-family HTH domain